MKRLLVFFAVLLNIMLLLSLIMTLTISTPATAGTNKWTQIAIPSTDDLQLAPGTDVGPIAVSPDGYTLFAAVYAEPSCEVLTPDNWYVYKSVDGGYTWMATGFVDDGSDIVAIDISPLWEDDEIIVVATTSDCYISEDRGNTFASMGATGLGNITSMDVGMDENGDAIYVIGTSEDVYILSDFSGWTAQYIYSPSTGYYLNTNGVLSVAFSPNYNEDGTVFAVIRGMAPLESDSTHLRAENDITVNNWGSYIRDGHFVDEETLANIIADSACIDFADNYNSQATVFVGLTAYSGSESMGDAFRVDLLMETEGISTVDDLDIRGVNSSTNVNSLAVSGEASSAIILVGLCEFSNIGPMSNWQRQIHYSYNGGESWLYSYKPPSGFSFFSQNCAPIVLMAPDFADSGIAYCGNGYIRGDTETFSGFYASTTHGTTWNGRGLLDHTINAITDVLPSPEYDNDSTLFMVTDWASFIGMGLLWETRDGGSHWELILGMTLMHPLPGVNIDTIRIPATYPVEPSIFVTGLEDIFGNPSAMVVRSTDEGNLFVTTFEAPYDAGTPLPVQAWAVIDNDTLIVSNANRIWKTTNTGAHWNETDTSEIAPNETVVDMQLFSDTAVLVGTDCGNVYLCLDWESDFSFTQVGSITLGADNSVYVAFDANFDDNGYIYAGVTDIGNNDDQEGIWRVDASTNASWDRLYDAGEDVYSIAHERNGRLWALADGSAVVSLNPTADDPDDVVFNIVNASLTNILTGNLETVGDRTFAIGGTNNTQLWTYSTPPSEVWVDDDYNPGACGGHIWGYDAFNKIQDGIDAVSGSTVHVAAGTYYENIVLKDGVELLGAGSDTTIIDGMQSGSVVTANNVGNNTVLDGFTITNGSGTYLYPDYSYGGGMFNNNSSPIITNCVFQSNMCTSGGGGMFNINASPIITNCTFENNSANSGGGIENHLNASPSITNCVFDNNTADCCGGGLSNIDNSSSIINNCTLRNNLAFDGGGIANMGNSSPTIVNCVLDSNSANMGGGIYNWECYSVITNCTFWNNSAITGGGGMINFTSSLILTNCILWNNNPDEIMSILLGPTVSFCNIQGGYSGIGNIDSDPLFVNAAAGDFHLSAGSPCIDAGSNSAPSIPALDFEGDPRILPVWGTVDMGVDEYIHPDPSCDSWDVRYRIVGGQITMNYSLQQITPRKVIIPLTEEHGGYMTFKFCKEANNGGRLVVIPQDSWYMENITVENVMTGIDMNLSIRLDSDASGILYVDDNIGDVDVSSESVSGRTPVQIDTIGDGTMDVAGSMLIPMTLVGDFNTSVGQSGELPFGMTFTTGNTTNVAHIPINPKMDGATMTSEGVPFAEDGGLVPYVGTNGTITATGTGDCLGIRLVGIRIDFQFEMKLELEPVPPSDFYGDADQDGALSIGDYSYLRLMLFNKQPFTPGGDVDQDGTLSIGDYSCLRLMLFNKQPIVNKYKSSYDFLHGAGSNKCAKSKTIDSVPPVDHFDNESGWTEAGGMEYNNIATTNGNVYTITGTPGLYSALQFKFTLYENPGTITSIGVTLNGSAETDGDVLQFWAWNFDTDSWRQIGSDFSMTTNIESYTAWTAWGKVYADYIDGDGYMYILANLNDANQDLNVDYFKLSVVW